MGIKDIEALERNWKKNDEQEGKGADVTGEIKEEGGRAESEQWRKIQADKQVRHTETNEYRRGPGLEGRYMISAGCMPLLCN